MPHSNVASFATLEWDSTKAYSVTAIFKLHRYHPVGSPSDSGAKIARLLF